MLVGNRGTPIIPYKRENKHEQERKHILHKVEDIAIIQYDLWKSAEQ